MAELKRISLDAREMEHPEPLEKAMKSIQSMDELSYFYMLHRKEPIPLIDLATSHHFQVLTEKDAHDQWHILICKNPSIKLSDLIDV